MALEAKTLETSHVLTLSLEVNKGMLPAKTFALEILTFVAIKLYGVNIIFRKFR